MVGQDHDETSKPIESTGASPSPDSVDERRRNDDSNLWVLAGAGMELAAAVGGFSLLGWWLDGWLGTSPWLLAVCGGIGVVGGLYNFFLLIRKYL